jgi:predicted metal-binding membrane protein
MNAALTLAYPRWRQFFWRHPESPVLLLSAGSWLLLAAGAMEAAPSLGLHPHHVDGGAAFHSSLTLWSPDHWPVILLRWSAMITAMMFPTLVPQIRVLAARSFWSRRTRAILLFLAGYSALWLIYGAIAEAAMGLLRGSAPAMFSFLLPMSLVLAGLWQLTRQKQRSLVACHFTMPIAPSGWQADLDCCRFGLRTAAYCCVSCWALMLVCAADGHAVWVMLVVAAVSLAERVFARPRQLWFGVALFLFAILAIKTGAH